MRSRKNFLSDRLFIIKTDEKMEKNVKKLLKNNP